MNILVACEFSGIVRDAFIAKGHDAISCDLMPTESLGPHYMGNVLDILDSGWDLLIAHPPCTYLCVSGARWFKDRLLDQELGAKFFMDMVLAHVPKIAVENPIGVMSTLYRKPDQIIQPWMFGHEETKATCLWLKNLPKLDSTKIVAGWNHGVHKEGPGPNRSKNRSRTFSGIALAMADQWG